MEAAAGSPWLGDHRRTSAVAMDTRTARGSLALRKGLLDGVWTMNDANAAMVERECRKDGRRMGEAGLAE